MSNEIDNKIKQNIILAPYTTYKIGGPSEFFLEINNETELINGINWAFSKNINVTILSGGSNVLINDTGVQGLVIKINNKELLLKGDRIEAGAGVNLIDVARLACNNSLSGLEWASGIPGSIGGAVRGNAGAHGKYIADVVETIKAFNKDNGIIKTFSNNDCEFYYKDSYFKQNKNFIILKVLLKLSVENLENIRRNVENYLKIREKSQPRLASAGCVFKNLKFSDIERTSDKLANYILKNNPPKNGKIGAGWLIDLLGLKGKKNGGVKISLEHANFIVNTGKGTADDVKQLINFIKKRVFDQFGIKLEEEIEYLE